MMPPRIALIAMVAIIILHVTVPPIIVPAPFSYTSVAVMAAGVAMIRVVTAGFQAAATLITPFTESTALIRHGFCWTRDPCTSGPYSSFLALPLCSTA